MAYDGPKRTKQERSEGLGTGKDVHRKCRSRRTTRQPTGVLRGVSRTFFSSSEDLQDKTLKQEGTVCTVYL
jgi:hypothetical protein